jgi:hypothetical protein
MAASKIHMIPNSRAYILALPMNSLLSISPQTFNAEAICRLLHAPALFKNPCQSNAGHKGEGDGFVPACGGGLPRLSRTVGRQRRTQGARADAAIKSTQRVIAAFGTSEPIDHL